MSNEASSSEGVIGIGMVVAAYVDENAADQVLDSMKQAKKDGQSYYDDAVVVRQDPKGKLHIKETGDMTSSAGAGIGGLIGGVIGLLGGAPGMVLGVAAGAAIGGIAAHHDAGFSTDSLKELGSALVPGSSALLITTSKDFVEDVRAQSDDSDRMTTAKEISATINSALQMRKDILLGIVVTEKGVAATQVISSPTELAVFGVATDGQSVKAGAAVSTADGTAYKVGASDGKDVATETGVVTEDGTTVVDATSTVGADEAGDAEAAAATDDTAAAS